MTEIDEDRCRKAAAECVELARSISDPAKKQTLLMRAQEWLKLAYAKNDAEFERHVAALNQDQMTPTPVQRQPMQQQQSKTKPEEEDK